MQSSYEICCGIDLHKDMLQACVLAGALNQEPACVTQRFGTQVDDLSELAQWLKQLGCPVVAMESTGAYWQPVYFALTDAEITCFVVNAQHIRNVPGHKSDMNDAHWIAHSLRAGYVRPSFVPDQSVQILRQYTRTYRNLIRNRSDSLNRIEKELQIHGMKLSSVLSDINSQTGIRLLRHFAKHGSITLQDVERLRDLNCHKDAQTIYQAIKVRLRPAVCRLLGFWLDELEQEDANIQKLYAMMEELFTPYQSAVEILDSIPGIAKPSAYQILGEIGADMSFFPSPECIASWAGLCPRCNESAGKHKSTRIMPGNAYLKGILNQCAFACCRDRRKLYNGWYWSLQRRVGTKKAIVALSRKLLILCYTLLSNGTFFDPEYHRQHQHRTPIPVPQ